MIVFTGAMLASAAISAIGSGVSAYGNYQKGRAQLARGRKQAERLEQQDALDFIRNTQAYNQYVEAESLAYMKDLENLSETYELNGIARQRSIESGLTQLADISDNFIQKAMARNKKLAEVQGARLAAGQTGGTTRRLENLQQAQADVNTAADAESMERAVGAFIFRDKNAMLQQEYANKNAYNQIRKPVFGPPPAAPQPRARPQDFTGRDLAFDIFGGALNAAGAAFNVAPQNPFGGGTQFGTNSSLPIPSFGGNSAASLGFSPSVAARGSFYQNPTFDLTSLGINAF